MSGRRLRWACPRAKQVRPPTRNNFAPLNKMPRCLEVFCGTKSVSKQLGPEWEVVSVDLFAKFEPTICADVHEWGYKAAFHLVTSTMYI